MVVPRRLPRPCGARQASRGVLSPRPLPRFGMVAPVVWSVMAVELAMRCERTDLRAVVSTLARPVLVVVVQFVLRSLALSRANCLPTVIP